MTNNEELIEGLQELLGDRQYLLLVADPTRVGFDLDVNSNMDPDFVRLVLENLKDALEQMSEQKIRAHFTPYVVRN